MYIIKQILCVIKTNAYAKRCTHSLISCLDILRLGDLSCYITYIHHPHQYSKGVLENCYTLVTVKEHAGGSNTLVLAM